MRELKSVCPYDCPDACGLILRVENDRLEWVMGNPHHSFTRGVLCQKMQHYEDTVHSPLRLMAPLKRIGAKGSQNQEDWVPISWEQALNTIASKWKHLQAQYGTETLARYSYAGTMGIVQGCAGDFFFRRIGATQQDRGICSPAKQYGYASVMGTTTPIRPQEAAHSDMIVLWGVNSLATNLHSLPDITKARKHGANVWVIDTHASYTVDMADYHLRVLPSSDGALALGLMHILVRDGLVDQDFIDQYVYGYQEFKETELDRVNLEWVAQTTGLSVVEIENFAHALATAKAPFIRLGSGLSRYGNGAMNTRLITIIPALLGSWKVLGGGLLSSAAASSFMGKGPMQNLEVATENHRVMPMIKLGEFLHKTGEEAIHALYVFQSNPAITAPDQNVVRAGLMRDDLFTVVHERFFTDTCRYADIVLPATSSVEHNDVYNSYGHYTLATGYQAISPVGQSKSNWWVFSHLAKRMGLRDSFFDLTEEELIQRVVNQSPRLSDSEKQIILSGQPLEMSLPDGYKLNIQTNTGKIQIRDDQDVHPIPCYLPPHGDQAQFWLINGNDKRILDSSFCERDYDDPEPMSLVMHPKDAEACGLVDGDRALVYNERGQVHIPVHTNASVTPGTVVTLGVWWQRYSSDSHVGINALTAMRFTDCGHGSTFYDVKVNVKRA